MIFPKVERASPEYVEHHMGHTYYTMFYDAENSLIFLNSNYRITFWRLLHDLGHHLLCLLPRVEFVYNLNMAWDWLDFMFTYKKYISLKKVIELNS